MILNDRLRTSIVAIQLARVNNFVTQCLTCAQLPTICQSKHPSSRSTLPYHAACCESACSGNTLAVTSQPYSTLTAPSSYHHAIQQKGFWALDLDCFSAFQSTQKLGVPILLAITLHSSHHSLWPLQLIPRCMHCSSLLNISSSFLKCRPGIISYVSFRFPSTLNRRLS
jgi:hypothetical protein